jgi:hypothetical protein
MPFKKRPIRKMVLGPATRYLFFAAFRDRCPMAINNGAIT